VITHQDQPAKHLFLLLTGRARYFFVTEKGQKVILLWIPPGEMFDGCVSFTAHCISQQYGEDLEVNRSTRL